MTQTLAVDADELQTRIVNGVAALEGADPTELPPLFDAVDPDALTAIFGTTEAGTERTGRVGFSYVGHEISVEFDDEPVVTIE